MNFLFVIHYPVYGGPHNQAIRLHAPLAARGWHQVVLQPDEPGNAVPRLRAHSVEVAQLPLHRLRAKPDPRLQWRFARGFPGEVAAIRRLIRALDIDLVVPTGLVNPHAALAARLEGRPVAWQLLDTFPPMALRRALMPIVTVLSDAIMTTGRGVAAAHPGALGFGERLFHFFPPVDTSQFRPDPARRAAARAEFGFTPDDLVIGNVGNLNLQKGHRTFIRAAAALRRSHPTARFAILGASYDHHAAYTESLWREAADLGLRLGHELIVRDPGARVAELAPAFDLFWLPSDPRSEGIPTVVEEAMALGLPVVTTDVGAVREAVDHGMTGYVVPPLDPEALAWATVPLIDNPSLREQFGAAGRAVAVQRFSVETCAAVHEATFEAAIQHQGARRPSIRRRAT